MPKKQRNSTAQRWWCCLQQWLKTKLISREVSLKLTIALLALIVRLPRPSKYSTRKSLNKDDITCLSSDVMKVKSFRFLQGIDTYNEHYIVTFAGMDFVLINTV